MVERPTTLKKVVTTVPLTIATAQDLATKYRSSTNTQMMLDGKPVTNIVVLGRVLSTQETDSSWEYLIDDGTGQLSVSFEFPKNHIPALLTKLPFNQRNWYVKFVIVLTHSINTGAAKFNGIYTEKVTNMNQITYHLMSCFLAHMHRTVGPIPDKKADDSHSDASNRSQSHHHRHSHHNDRHSENAMVTEEENSRSRPIYRQQQSEIPRRDIEANGNISVPNRNRQSTSPTRGPAPIDVTFGMRKKVKEMIKKLDLQQAYENKVTFDLLRENFANESERFSEQALRATLNDLEKRLELFTVDHIYYKLYPGVI